MSSLSSDPSAVAALAAQLEAAATQLGELDDANREAGRVVIAATDPPRASGAMDAGQTVRVAEWGAQLVSTVGYWTFVHWGAPAAGVRARPWFLEAADRSVEAVRDVYLEHARRVLDTIT